jgi:hypothetical protein
MRLRSSGGQNPADIHSTSENTTQLGSTGTAADSWRSGSYEPLAVHVGTRWVQLFVHSSFQASDFASPISTPRLPADLGNDLEKKGSLPSILSPYQTALSSHL